jgi:ABC-2 type transport system permease protein
MFFLSGAMYPVRLLPDILKIAAKVNPLTYGIDAIKHTIFPHETGPMGPDFSPIADASIIFLLSIAFVLIAAKAFERKK